MAEKEVRKTVRKRAVRKSAGQTTPARASRAAADDATLRPRRKAPSRVVVEQGAPKGRRGIKFVFVGFFLFLILLGVSAAIGYTDKGELDVQNTIAAKKESATPEEKAALDAASVTSAQQSGTPNGGLVGTGAQTPDAGQGAVPTPSAVASSSASSTPKVASSSPAAATTSSASATSSPQ